VRALAVVQQNAAVLRVALDQDERTRSEITSVVADRDCPAATMVAERGVPVSYIREPDNLAFSDRLLSHAEAHDIDYIFLFFGRILRGGIIDVYQNRIVNIHPSLLPAFRGLDGFGDTYRSGVRFVGTTLHFIDATVDEGRVIQQAVVPLDWNASEAEQRQRQFEQMTRSFVQVFHWISDNRVTVTGPGTVVEGARFDRGPYSPELEEAGLRLQM